MEKFSLPVGIQRIYQDGKVIVINPDVPAWIVTNPVGELIIDLFNGNNTIDDIVDTVVSGIGVEKRSQVKLFCDKVVESGLLTTVVEKDNHTLFPLHIVHLSLSDNCNLTCRYCYAAQRKEHTAEKLSLEQYKRLIDDIKSLNPHCAFNITGGEPLLNPLWYDIAKYAKSPENELLLLSNGTLISENNIECIKEVFDTVIISIDGSSSDIHRLTRGDNYSKVINAINLFEKYGVEYRLSMTVTRLNISDVESMAKKYGDRLRFAPLFPVSDVAKNDLSITGREYFKALKDAAGVDPLFYCESSFANAIESRLHKCAIGDGEISISATGDVYPCQLLHSQEFYSGNVKAESVIDIYYHSEALAKCAKLDVDNIEGCKTCAFRYICGGACRARAFYECGDITQSGKFCEYERAAFIDGLLNLYSENALLE